MQERLLTVKEAAVVAVASRSLVYDWIRCKLFPVYRRGAKGRRGKLLIPEATFLAFLETQKVEADAAPPPPPPPLPKPRFRHLKL